MVSAVFHSPLEQARADKAAGLTPHTGAAPRKAGAASSPATTASVPSRSSSSALRDALQQALMKVLPPLAGLALLVLLWQITSIKTGRASCRERV